MGGGCSSLSGALSLNFSVKYAQQLHMHQLIKVLSQAQKNWVTLGLNWLGEPDRLPSLSLGYLRWVGSCC